MPRYKFSWDRLPTALLHGLTTDLDLDADADAPAALRHAFGARPSDGFVQAAWPTLRDAWLTNDGPSRIAVVERLRACKLGDLAIDATTESAQMAYLRSCRNTATHRGIVLDVFLAVGATAETPCVADCSVTPSRRRSRAWPQFTTALAANLGALEEDHCLVISRKDRPWFVQFAAQGSFGMRAELVSNSYLDDADDIADESIAKALALGWGSPTGDPDTATADLDPDGSPNYFRDWPHPVAFIDVARMAVDTLADVLAAPHPGTLTYTAFTAGGMQLLLPGLGLKLEGAQPSDDGAAPASPPPGRGVLGAAEVSRQLLELVRALSGNDELDVDPDGDIPLQYGTAMVFVRVLDDPPIVRVFSPVLSEARAGIALVGAVNELNGQQLFVKWAVHEETVVVASMDLFGDPLTIEHVLHACGVVGETVNAHDDQLQERFGGRTFFGDYTPPKLDGDNDYL